MTGVLWPRNARILIPVRSCTYANEDGLPETPVVEVGSIGGCVVVDLPLEKEWQEKLGCNGLQLRLDCEEAEAFIGAMDTKLAEALGCSLPDGAEDDD
jgi:hypothetical protein